MPSMDEKISVIVPVYNVEEYVAKCLDSLLAQTYGNLEIICVDDGSTDRSGQICEEYRERDNRLIVLHKKNGGPASARNMGLGTFTGAYVSFVDPDDWVEADLCERLLNAMKSDPRVDFVTSGYYMDYPDGRSIPIINEVELQEGPVSPPDYLYYVYQRDLYRGVAGYPVGKLFKRKFFDSPLRIWFDEEYLVGEDVRPLARWTLKSNEIYYDPKPLYHYFQRETSLSHVISNSLNLSDADSYKQVVDALEGRNGYERACAYAKRFLVYHASLIMEYTISVQNRQKTAEMREMILSYLDVYLETNSEYPDRIQRIRRLLAESDRLLGE